MEEQKQRKKLSLGLRLFIILMAVTLLLCATVFGIWLHGRSVLRSKTVKAPTIDQSDDTQLDSYTIYRDGKYYRYKDGMVNLLLMGVDADEKFDQPHAYGGDYQADVILLAALDTVNDQMTLISVSRDTMCDITILEDDQHQQGVAHAQIALSYAYGDGLSVSCELCREAVSTLFHGLEIDGYGAFFLGGVGKLNDAMGGVTVAVPQDLPGLAVFRGMTPGGTATLTGEQARAFIQWREETATGNDGRMQRQKLFLLGAIDQLRRQIKSNPASVLSLYTTVNDYILTDLDLSRIVYLATEAASMQFSGDLLRVPTGEGTVSAQNHLELPVDEEGLNDLILSVFYEEFTPDAN